MTEEEIRKPLTVTVRRASELSGLSQSTIHRLLNAQTGPKLTRVRIGSRTLIRLAELDALLSAGNEAA